MGEYLVDGEWLPKAEADRRMMYRALERIMTLEGIESLADARAIASDTIGFVGELAK